MAKAKASASKTTNNTDAGKAGAASSSTQVIAGAEGSDATGSGVIGGADSAGAGTAGSGGQPSGGQTSSAPAPSAGAPEGAGSSGAASSDASGFVLSAGVQSGTSTGQPGATGGNTGSNTGSTEGANGAPATSSAPSSDSSGASEGRRFILQSTSGDGGAPVILGTTGNDNLVGTSASEALDGGLGQDTLTGGAGGDRFAFEAGGSTQAAPDLITDFRSGNGGDRIDLSGLRFATGANGAIDLNWGGTTPTAYGVWFQVSNGVTRVFIDTDGTPATAESVLSLSGNFALTAADFLGVKQAPAAATTANTGAADIINTPATISGKTGDTLTETDAVLTSSGRLVATDPDSSADFAVRTNAPGNNAYGVFSINAQGDWTYRTNTAQNQFEAGRTYTDSITVRTADGTQQVLTITIRGTNDAAVITGDLTTQVTETDSALSATGKLNITDAEGPAAFTPQTSTAGEYGSFSIDTRGNWSYQAGANNALTAGQTVSDAFTVTAADGTPRVVTITLVGTNDTPVFGAPTVTALNEDDAANGAGNLVAQGNISVTDADAGQSSFSGAVSPGPGTLGALVIQADGSYTYTVASGDVQHLTAGSTKVETFTVTAADGTPTTLSFTLTGTNDAAVIGAPTVASVTEDQGEDSNGNLVASGSISINDVDKGESSFSTTVLSANGNLGTLSLAADGQYTYTVANSATQSLGATDSHIDTFTVTAADGTTQVVSFTVQGSNDLPVISVPTVASALSVAEDTGANEAGHLVASGSISITDADAGQNTFITTVTGPQDSLGNLVLSSNGAYTYTVANTLTQYLGDGEVEIETFTVTAADGTQQTISFTITGSNDAAVIGAPTFSSVTEDTAADDEGNLVASGSISIDDADTGQSSFSSHTGAQGNLGALALTSTGNYVYTVANRATQELGAGDSHVDTFTVTSADGSSTDISFTIHGSNDKAVIGAPEVSSVTEDTGADDNGNLVASGVISIEDADRAESSFQTLVTGAPDNLGMLSLTTSGSYTYTVANSATQSLGAGQSKTDTFTVTAADGTTQQISFTVNGTNDDAVIGAPSVSNVTEDEDVNAEGQLVAMGSISINDADSDQNVFGTTVQAADGNLGTLSLANNGQYTYTAANSATQNLGDGVTKVDTFTVSAIDGSTKAISFTITGSNDAAEIGAPSVAEVTEDAGPDSSDNLVATGTIGISDADTGESLFSGAPQAAAGTLGTLALAADGSYTYTVANSLVQSLGEGQTKVETFSLTTADGSSKDISFTVRGTNDAAVIEGAATAQLTETDGVLEASGTLTVTDVDGDAVFNAIDGIQGSEAYGSFTIDAAGNWTYKTNEAHDSFVDGREYVDTITVTTADGTSQTLSVTITGTNDAAAISASLGALEEGDEVLTTGGTLVANDLDNENGFEPQTDAAGSNGFGVFSINEQGEWTYATNTAQNEFEAGQTYTDTVTVKSLDGTTATITVTITGTNDAAVLSADSKTLTETDEALSTSGTLTISDVDSATTFVAQTGTAGEYGSFSVNSAGEWTFTASSAFNELNTGDARTDRFMVESADGTITSVTVTITGSNDAAQLSSATSELTEGDAPLSASGTLTATDVDSPATFVAQSSTAGTYGTFTVNSAGAWSFTANEAFNALEAGEKVGESFTVASADGTTTSVTINITGTNDAAVLSTAVVSLDETDEPLTASGTLTVADVDSDASFVAQTDVEGSFGRFSIDAQGAWTYTANEAMDELQAGERESDSFEVLSADGTKTTVTINVTGTNDAAVIEGTATAQLTETDGVLEASGTLSATDVDSDAGFTPIDGAQGSEAYGSFTIDAAGSWTYKTNEAHDWFVDGQEYIDTITVTTADGTEKTLSVTITGSNDAASISASLGALDNALTEGDAVLTTSGTLVANDVDNENGFQPQTDAAGSNGFGVFSINEQGEWTYATNTAQNEFEAGQTYTDTVTVKSLDGTTATITVTITGTNDAAVLSADSKTLTETDEALSTSGTLTISDVDSATTFVAQTGTAGEYGSFSVNSAGEWTFTASSAFNELNTGDARTDRFMVESADGTITSVTVTITGSNDAAQLSSATSELTEGDAPLSASGTLTATDVDSPATFVAQSGTAGTYGTFTVNSAGAWSFTANEAFNALEAGEKVGESFTVASADGTTTSVTINITGTNDAAVLSTAVVSLDETDEPLTASGTLTVADVDSDASFVAQTDVEGSFGRFSIDAQGAWTYTANEAMDELQAGERESDSFEVLSADGTKTTVTINVTGTNDAAVIEGTATAQLTETDGVLEASGTLSATDVDSDAGFTPIDGAQGSEAYGSFTIDAAGSWTYKTNEAHDWFVDGQEYIDTITVTTADGTEKTLSVTITGSNDAASISASLGALDNALTEGDAVLTTSGTLFADDVDNENGFQPQSVEGQGGYGVFTINEQGEWTYATNTAQNEFEAGKTYTDSVTVKSLDGTAATITVTITGTNDAAVLSADQQTLTETDEALTTSGTLTNRDVDSPQTFVAQERTEGLLGNFSVDEDGAWQFTAHAALNELNVGDTRTENYRVEAADGTATSVTITITGSNDAAVITGATKDDVVEIDSRLSAGGKISATDVDNDDASFVVQDNVAGSKNYGVFSIDSEGYWSFTANTALNQFAPGVTYTDTFTVKTADGTEQVISVNIMGTNDAPVVTAAQAATLSEDAASPTVSAFANASDVDENTTLQVVGLPPELPAGVSFNASTGEFTLDLSQADYQQLQNGQSTVVTVNYNVSDGIAQVATSVSWTVTGANDAPVVKAAEVVALTEDLSSPSTLDALAGASDADADAELSVVFDTDTLPPGVGYDAQTQRFTLDPSAQAFQSLGEGVSQTVTVSYQVTDGIANTPASLSWTITGTNDAPVVSGTRTTLDAATEDTAYTVTREQLLAGFTDADSSDTLAVKNLSFDQGTITDNGDGTYTVNPNANYNGNGTLSYTVSDGRADVAATLALSVTAVNDAPTTAAITLEALLEDGGSRIITQADLLASAADVDNANADLKATGLSLADGVKGTLVDNEDGSWTYTPAADDDSGVTFNYTIIDGSGGSTAGTATMDLTAVDDLSRISGEASDSLSETNAAVTTSGQLLASDVDGPNGKLDFVAQTDVAGSGGYGKFSINTQGEWTYTANSAHDAFKEGETFVDTITVAATDGVEQVLTVTIVGTNDAAVITGKTTSQLTETNAVLQTTGQMGVTDVDSPSSFLAQTGLVGSQGYGTLDITANGMWTYTTNTARDVFAPRSNYSETVTVQAADGTEQTITISIRGTNDAPVVQVSLPNAATEDAATSTVDALAHASDVDEGTQLQVTNLPAMLPDGVSYDAATHSFTLNTSHASFQSLAQGQTTTVTVNYGVTDGVVATATPASISWTVTGTNDQAVIGTPTSSLVTEDTAADGSTNLVVTGSISINDIDTGEGFFQTTVTGPDTNLGSLELQANGSYTYTVDNQAVQYLGQDDTKTESFTVTAADGTTKVVSFTLQGTNDAPVVTVGVAAAATEDGLLSTIDALANASDVDAGTQLSVTGVPDELPAGVSFDASTHTFTLNPASSAFQSLAAGQTQTVTVNYGVSDGTATTPASVSWTVTGTNDAPVVTPGAAQAVTEDGARSSVNALANASDVDAGTQLSVTNVPAQLPAGVSYDATTRTFTLDPASSAYQSLAAGQNQTVTVNYGVSDGTTTTPASVSWTVTGTDDASVISGHTTRSLTEADMVLSTSGQLTATDVDSATSFVAQNATAGSAGYGSFSVNASGFWTYNTFNAQNQFVAGQTYTDTFTVSTTDGTTQVLSVTITGTNDGPVAVNNTAVATEKGGTNNSTPGADATGNVITNDTDVDGPASELTISGFRTGSEGGSGNAGTVGSALNGSFGALTLNADGTYSYVVNENSAAVQALPPGGALSETFTYTVRDAGGRTDTGQLTVTVQGANDAPTAQNVALQVNQLGNGGFDSATPFTGWTVSTASSGMDYVSSSTATIDRSGSVISGDPAVAVLNFEGGVPNAFGTGYGPSITSAPFTGQAGDTVRFVYQLSSGGDHAIGTGVIRDAQTGNVVQTVFNYQTGFSGSTGVVTNNVILSSSGTYTIEFRIGSYDASGGLWVGARLDLGFAGILRNGVGENESFTFASSNFLSSATDPDGGTLSLSAVSNSASGASLTLNANGSVVYNPNGGLDFLAAGQQITDTFQYTVSDGRGGTTTATASINVVGANDAPVVSGAVTGTATEDGATVSISALANASDVDRGTTLSVVNVPASLPAGVTYNAATQSFVLNPAHASYQSLAQGASTTVTVSYGVSDGTATTPATATFTVTGTDDKAVITGTSTANLTETNAVLNTSGQLTATDVDSTPSFVAQTAVAGSNGYGSFSVDASGRWTYTTNSAHDQFVAGQTYTDQLTVATADGTTQVLTVNIAGTPERTAAVADTQAIVEGAGSYAGSVATNDSAGNPGTTLTYTRNIQQDLADNSLQVLRGTTFDGKQYFVVSNSNGSGMVPDALENQVRALGGHLTTISSAQENSTVLGLLQGAGVQRAYIGLNDAQTEGNHTWADGSTTSYRNWAGTEPNNHSDGGANGEDYVEILSNLWGLNGQWNDAGPGFPYAVVEFSDDNLFSLAADGSYTVNANNTAFSPLADGQVRNLNFNYTVSDGTTSANSVLTVQITGATSIINGTVNNDVLTGTVGRDVINGGNGNDVISGGQGADYLTGGAGADTFVFNTAPGVPDTVRDFQSAEGDKLQLSLDIFTALQHDGNGNLAESIYFAGEGTQAPDQHLVFDKSTGLLSYDADGGGSGTAQAIAKLDNVTSLTQDDFKLTGGSGNP